MRSSDARYRRLVAHLRLRSVVPVLLTTVLSLASPLALNRPALASPAFAPTPAASINLPSEAFLGQDFTFPVTFANSVDPGYGPFIDLIFPVTGVDGAGAAADDGLDFLSATAYGTVLTATSLTFLGSGCVNHPYAVTVTGAPVQVCGGTPGDKLVVLLLPFGSFVPAQPAVNVTVAARLSGLADLGVPLTVRARGGFQFGMDPLNNPATDPSILSGFVSDSVRPTLFTLSKTYLGPEDETATGPNFPRQYLLAVDIANGQTVSSLSLQDLLPDNMQYVSVISSVPAVTCIEPSLVLPGGTLDCDFNSSVTGTTDPDDATLTFEFYIPELDSLGGAVIDPDSGDDEISIDDARADGMWTPTDARDPAGPVVSDLTSNDHTLTDKSIAIQKSDSLFIDAGGPGPTPGDTLEYTLAFQVSDYFTFGDLIATDVFSDGQRLDSGFAPTLSVSDRAGAFAGPFTPGVGGDLTVDLSEIGNDPNPATDGTTRLVFDVSAAMVNLGAADGVLQGGRALAPDAGGAIGTITYRTIIQDTFSDTYPSGDQSVDQGDLLDNTVWIDGTVRDNADPLNVVGDEDDDSGASTIVARGEVEKTVYAVRGSTSFSIPIQVSVGDTLTYRIHYSMPSSDVEQLHFHDYLPLPVFLSSEIITGFADDVKSATPPVAGHVQFGLDDTFSGIAAGGISGIVPSVSSDPVANSLTIDYGTYDDPFNRPSVVDLLFTVTITDEPFADRLFLTNLVRQHEGSTNGGEDETDTIIQIQVFEPVLRVQKGVVGSDNPADVYTPANVGLAGLTVPSAACPRFTPPKTSAGLASAPINSNMSGVDAGDIVSFAVVVENTGSSERGAFDVRVRDTIPPGFQTPGAGVNLCVTNGVGTLLPYAALGGGFFDAAGGIELVDTAVPADGSLAAGRDSAGVLNPSGTNIAILTYDLELQATVQPSQALTNTATLFNYASTEGGENFVPGGLTDPATVTVAAPIAAKLLFSTEIVNANNSNTQAVIGEIVTYRLVLTIPEGVTSTASVVDTLDTGLAFVDCLSIARSSSALTTTAGGGDFSEACSTFISPPVSSPGRTITWNLGSITNSDRDDSLPETITIEYRAVVLNVAGNQTETQLNNSAQFRWGAPVVSVTASAPNVTVIEPVLDISKTAYANAVTPAVGDAGDPVEYVLILRHAASSPTDAFEVVISDPLPRAGGGTGASLIQNAVLSSVVDSAGTIDSSYFLLSGDNASGFVLQTATPFDFPRDLARTITLRITGTLSILVEPGTISNQADTTWTSMDGPTVQRSAYNTNSTERTGAGGVNDYLDLGSDVIQINPGPGKLIVATSEDHTPAEPGGDELLAIGEIVRYRLSITLPEGTATNLQIRDTLPQGLLLLDAPQVRLSFSADQPMGLPGDLAGAENGAIPPTFVLPAGRIATSMVGSQQQVVFTLGNLVNNDDDPDAETITLEFNALVDNSVGGSNDAGDDRDNTFTLWVDDAQVGAPSNPVLARIVEPSITDLDKTIGPPAPLDAGDIINYRLTFSNAAGLSTTDAFDLTLEDPLPADIALNLGSIAATSAGDCATGLDTSGSSGNTVRLAIARIPAGCAVTIDYQALVLNTVNPDDTIANTASLDYTSLPGTNGTTSNATGSSTPGASGADNGERDGSGGHNDYADTALESFDIASPALTKTTISTSAAHTGTGAFNGANWDLAIGEVVTFEIVVSFPEGTTTAVLTDDLPYAAGVLSLVSSRIVAVGTNLSGPGLPAVGSPGIASDVNLADGYNDRVVFGFGTVLNTPDGVVDEKDQIVLEVIAQAVNILANQSGDTLVNTAALDYTSGTISDDEAVEVVEPELDLAKGADDTTPYFGQTLNYSLTLSHLAGSASTAMDVTVTDIIPTGLTLVGGSVAVPATWTWGYDVGLRTLTFSKALFDAAESPAVFTYQATVGIPPAVALNDVMTNPATALWTSLPGVDLEERTGAGGVDDYHDDTSVSVTVTGIDLQITKDDGGESTLPGATLVYALTTRNVGNIDATGVTVNDIVPAYTTFFAGASTPGWVCSDPDGPGPLDAGDSGSPCVLALGTLAAGGSQVVDFGLAVDDPVPAGVTQIENTAEVDDDGTHGEDPTPEDNQDDDVTPLTAGPDLNIDKDDGVDVAAAGSALTYSLVFSNVGDQGATGVVITDSVPPNTLFSAAGSSAGWSCDDPDGAGPLGPGDPGSLCSLIPDVGFGPGVLPAGEGGSVNFGLVVDNPLPAGVDQVLNTARITDDGSNGGDPTPEDNEDDDLDYLIELGEDFAKALVATDQPHTSGLEVAIGEVVTYEVTLRIPEGGVGLPNTLDNVQMSDTLQQGLAFVACESITADAGLSTSLGTFNDACNDPLNPQVLAEPPGDPLVVNQGRRVVYSLGDVSNAAAGDAAVVIRYRAVVLDDALVVRGATLGNHAALVWEGGEIAGDGPTLSVVEPTIEITKSAAPLVAPPGALITFSLDIAHSAASDAEAFDILLSDVVPVGLTYVPGSLRWAGSGLAPDALDESAAPQLEARWASFPLGSASTIEFDVTMALVLYDQHVTNTGNVEWTSLPEDDVQAPNSLSNYNVLSTERYYDPGDAVDAYGTSASVEVSTPALPATGFAPGRISPIPQRPVSPYEETGGLVIEIARLEVSVPIVGVPLGDLGWDLTWLGEQAGYLEGTAFPTWAGNSAITGHVYLPDGGPGPFVRLAELAYGDEIVVHAFGMRFVYSVREVRQVLPDDLSVLRHEDRAWLTLITCKDYEERRETYRTRVAVRAVMVGTLSD